MYKYCRLRFAICSLLLVILCIIVAEMPLKAQEKSVVSNWGINSYYGFVFAHSDYVTNTKYAKPRGVSLQYSTLHNDSATINKFKCAAFTGWQLSYFDYNTSILGTSVTASYFMQPIFRIGSNTNWFMKTAFGLSYLTSPFDSFTHPENQTYSLHWNVYLQLGMGINHQLNKHWSIALEADLLHNSNGGINKPNRGINYPSLSVGLYYQTNKFVGTNKCHFFKKDSSGLVNKSKNEIQTFAGYKNIENSYFEDKHNWMYGISYKRIFPYNAFHNFSVGAIFCYDTELKNLNKTFSRPANPYMLSFLFGHEFIFRKIIFSQQMGWYVFADLNALERRFKQYNPMMHQWNISYVLNKNYIVGGGLKAHQQIADFINIHIGYRW